MKYWTFFVLAALLLTTGCKDDDDFIDPDRQRSYLHIVSGAAVPDTFEITLDYWNADNVVIGNFTQNRNWPMVGYADLEEGGEPDEFGYGKMYLTATRYALDSNRATDTLSGPGDILLEADNKSTIFFTDSTGTLVFRQIDDDYTTASAGNVNLRLMNLNGANANIMLRSTDGAINIASTAFLEASGFAAFPTGTYDLEIVDAATSTVVATRTQINFFDQGTFSVYLDGGSNVAYWNH